MCAHHVPSRGVCGSPSSVRVLMVDAVRRDPEDRAALERERGAPGQEVLDRFRCLVATVRQQPVIAHADPQHAGDDVQHQGGEDRAEIP